MKDFIFVVFVVSTAIAVWTILLAVGYEIKQWRVARRTPCHPCSMGDPCPEHDPRPGVDDYYGPYGWK